MPRPSWRGREERLVSRIPTLVILLIHVVLYFARIPLSLIFPIAGPNGLFRSSWVPILALEALLHAVGLAFLLMAMAKERAEREQRIAASTDELTGVANRRAFLAEGGRRLAATPAESSAALLLFDLDHFKASTTVSGMRSATERCSYSAAPPWRISARARFLDGWAEKSSRVSSRARRRERRTWSPSASGWNSRRSFSPPGASAFRRPSASGWRIPRTPVAAFRRCWRSPMGLSIGQRRLAGTGSNPRVRPSSRPRPEPPDPGAPVQPTPLHRKVFFHSRRALNTASGAAPGSSPTERARAGSPALRNGFVRFSSPIDEGTRKRP